MSFDQQFDARWERVLKPALEGIQRNGVNLTALRVDLGVASDAILTEILQHIGDASVIVADISAVGDLGGRPIRNANVLYEVGLAHAARLPEEVVLFRSDQLKLDFDVAGVRVHRYDPDNDEDTARRVVTETVLASLSALNERARLSVRWATERLTQPALFLLLELAPNGRAKHPQSATFRDVVADTQRSNAIELLLELGAVRSELVRFTPELLVEIRENPSQSAQLLEYTTTAFGNSLATHLMTEMGAFSSGVRELVEELLQDV